MLKIYYQNCRGLKTKTHEFRQAIEVNNYDVVAITETWLNENFLSNELFDNRYIVYRKDRNRQITGKNEGGGVLIAILKKFKPRLIASADNMYEDIWIKILLSNNVSIILSVVYLSQINKFADYETFFQYCCDTIDQNSTTMFLLLGDFNINNIKWEFDENGNLKPFGYEGRIAELLVDSMEHINANQFNQYENYWGNILDLVLSNIQPLNVHTSICLDPICNIDKAHLPLFIDVNIGQIKYQNKSIKSFINFKKLNYLRIANELDNIDWALEFSECDVDECLDFLYKKIFASISHDSTTSQSKKRDYPIWFSDHLISLIKQKHHAFTNFKRYGNEHDKNQFVSLRKQVKSEINLCHQRYVQGYEKKISEKPQYFWNYIKSFSKKSDFPLNMHDSSNSSDDKTIISNMFASFFESVYNNNYSNDTQHEFNTNQPVLTDIFLLESSMVEETIAKIDITKGAGTDGIPNLFVKELMTVLSTPLAHIFNLSLKSGIFPMKWKEVLIIPVFKDGDPAIVTNYRPISILNAFSKIFEKIIHQHVFFNIKHLLSLNQHGFYEKRSTISNLIHITDFLSTNMDKNTQVDVIYTDFSKAFDKVDHIILLEKLDIFGFSNNLLKWFKSYLIGRNQQVFFNGVNSRIFTSTSGIPQGSILGPLLFIIFINDICDKIKSDCILYADDLKIFRQIISVDDCELLQRDIDVLYSWSLKNNLHLNIMKCNVLTFTRKSNPIVKHYYIDNALLNRKNSTRDLGVHFDAKLRFNEHIDHICKKAAKMLGLIQRLGKHFRDIKTFKLLFNSLVRCQLEYATQIWNPFYGIHIERIERLQRKFTRFIYFKFRLNEDVTRVTYKNRLLELKMHSLEVRRSVLDELTLFKIVNSHIDCPYALAKINFAVRSYTTRRNDKSKVFKCNISRTNIGLSTTLTRLQCEHNKLFCDLDLFGYNLNDYKSLIYEKLSYA